MKNIGKGIYLTVFVFLVGCQLIQTMEPIEKGRTHVFKWQNTEAMRRVLHTMITDLPVPRLSRAQDRNAYITTYRLQLEAIGALIQTPLFDPGAIIAELIARRGLGNILYDVARENRYQETMNWFIDQGLVNFAFIIKNDSSYEINVSGVSRVQPGKLSSQILMNTIQFPMTFQGYGEFWGKFIQEKKLEKSELVRELAKFNLPSGALIKIAINLVGNKPPYSLTFSYEPLKNEEIQAKNRIETRDPLDLFAPLKHHQLTESSRSTRWSSFLTANDILSWADVTNLQDPILNEIVLTKISAGRYTRRDIYRYILNLPKDNYTAQDIQKSFDQLVQEMGHKYVPGWDEYLTSQGLAAGPFSWLAMLSRVPINKDTVISDALRLLRKAYQNLMMDKGENVGE